MGAATLIVGFVGCGIWLGARAFLAQHEVSESQRLAGVVEADIGVGKVSDARAGAEQLAVHVDALRQYVSDPLWQAAGWLPVVGTNFSTSARLAGILSDVTHEAVLPLSGVIDKIDASKVKPANGILDLQALAAAQPTVGKAASALQDAYTEVTSLGTGFGTLPEIRAGVAHFKEMLSKAKDEAAAANTAAEVLPSMLGKDRPHNYLVLFLNNAELRSTGGIPGAVALVHVDQGHISLAQQATAGDFPHFPQPVLPLAATTQGLYGAIGGEYLQDVNLTPQFPLTARLAAEMWKQRYGQTVDGVLSFDPVALSYLLDATGPVKLPTGENLDAGNAVRVLLSDSYSKYEGAEKDGFFASAASAVFSKLAAGRYQPKPMLDALNHAAGERRLLAWSPVQKEEDAIEAANLSGWLPTQRLSHGVFGVYLNDATGAKMDYYLRESYSIGGVKCRSDGRPTWQLEVTLTNAAPTDAATSLPAYVTGGGDFGVRPGDVKTQVNVYAPPSGIYLSSSQNGNPLNVHRDMDSGYPVAQTSAVLSPGQTVTLTFQFLGAPNADAKPDIVSTPTVNNPLISDLSLSCQDVVR